MLPGVGQRKQDSCCGFIALLPTYAGIYHGMISVRRGPELTFPEGVISKYGCPFFVHMFLWDEGGESMWHNWL